MLLRLKERFDDFARLFWGILGGPFFFSAHFFSNFLYKRVKLPLYYPDLESVPIRMMEFSIGIIRSLVGMRSKVVALGLDQVGR